MNGKFRVIDRIISSILINFGPQHPSTHGASRSISISYGEIIQWITAETGLSHRGTEKLIDLHYYNSAISHPDRFDHVPTITQELLFIYAMERIMSFSGSIHESTIRTIILEYYRIRNHAPAITTNAIDTGSFTTMLRTLEEREKLINFSEIIQCYQSINYYPSCNESYTYRSIAYISRFNRRTNWNRIVKYNKIRISSTWSHP